MFRFHFEGGGRRSRFFGKGDLKYIILDLLKDRPAHGYEIMRALEEQFHGLYSPSAGSVYPTLQLLEDMGYVKAAEQDGKKVYTITEAGLKFLKDSEATVGRIKGHMHEWWEDNRDDIRDTFRDVRDLGRYIREESVRMTQEQKEAIKTEIAETIARIRKIIND
jgi:DNA-binding PadR family transcriptional regulator